MYFYPVRLSVEPFELQFRVPFVITHGVRTHTSVVYIRIDDEGFSGYGEAALPPYLPETKESVMTFIREQESRVETFLHDREALKMWMHSDDPNRAARACLEMAILDLNARKKNSSLQELLGISPGAGPLCSLTIGAGTKDELITTIRSHPEFRLFKLKLNGEDDLDRIRAARSLTDVPLAVDLNGAWKDADRSLPVLEAMHRSGVILVEQPFGKDDVLNYGYLKDRSPLPVIADESVSGLNSLHSRWHLFHGVNVKLMKSPGLFESIEMIRFLREKDMKVLIGCMSESSCGVSAAAALAPMADWIDLDGPQLINNDPFSGIRYENGRLVVEGKTGTGVRKRS